MKFREVIKITDIDTWPIELRSFVNKNYKAFIGWECAGNITISSISYDKLIENIMNILINYQIQGFHCTKLLKKEIIDIRNDGLKLQDRCTLSKRIDKLIQDSIINLDVGIRFKNENQSDDFNRKNKIWFCFYHPKLAGEHGIYRFFNSWGGEALYNTHERDSETGIILKKIGIPCIIEAIVPMSLIPKIRLPYSHIIRFYLEKMGYELEDPYFYESYINEDLPSKYISYIHEYPSKEFKILSGYDKWRSKL